MWYVVQTLKGRERKDAEGIRHDVAETGEEAFVFESEKLFRLKKEWIKEHKPLFPGYIFISTGDIEGFEKRLYRKYHSLRLLTVDGIVTPITKKEEEYLLKIGGEEHIVKYSEGIRIDDTVKILSGPFKDGEGRIVKLDRHNRKARIALPLMGREIEVEIGLGIVKSIKTADRGNRGAD